MKMSVDSTAVQTYAMAERAVYLDFDIRDQSVRTQITRPHRHEYFQIMIILDGSAQQTIGGSVRPVQSGTLIFVLPYRVHLALLSESARFVVINFSQRFFRPDLDVDPLDLEDVPISRVPELAPFLYQEYMDFVITGPAASELQTIISQMEAENGQRGFGSLEILRGRLLQLIGLTCRCHEIEILRLATVKSNISSRREALFRVTRYIRENLANEHLSLTDAAAAAFLSPNYLAHLLKKEVGKSFTDLVTERRMECAQVLLANTPMRIADVAHASGFCDEGYFTRRFKQWYGTSPRAYRDTVRTAISSGTATL